MLVTLLCAAAFFCWSRGAWAQDAPQPGTSPSHPQAKTEQERLDFNQAYALTGGAASEAAADAFAVKYPDSALRRYLYTGAMLQYQRENNAAKMEATGDKVLALDPDNPLALVLTATVVADSLIERDRDREHKVGIIKRNTARAIQAAEAAYGPASGAPTAALYKDTLQSMAYSALGIMKLKSGDDAGAEKDLKQAAELGKVRPDPYIWYHLALAQDHRKKYTAALTSVAQALQLSSSNPDLQKLAEAEHERLSALARGPRNAGSEPQ
jgi:tetratricopeptide (TPR) repeat protein